MVTSSTILSGWLLCFKNRLRLGHFPEIFENTETNYCRTYLIILASVQIFLWLWYFWHKIALMIFISLSCCDLTAIHCIKNEITNQRQKSSQKLIIIRNYYKCFIFLSSNFLFHFPSQKFKRKSHNFWIKDK